LLTTAVDVWRCGTAGMEMLVETSSEMGTRLAVRTLVVISLGGAETRRSTREKVLKIGERSARTGGKGS